MEDRPVYSTDPAFCAACRSSPCICQDPSQLRRRQPGPVKLSFQRGGKGSGVTRVEGIVMHPTLKEELLKSFKKRLGCGGTVKDGVLELQGDRRDLIERELKAQGYQVKRKGG